MDDSLRNFLRESLHIEGIERDPTQDELTATEQFFDLMAPNVDDVVRLVSVYAPHARLRALPNLNVRVGGHVAPAGGPEIPKRLAHILFDLHKSDPWATHCAYEHLHPFTDGNGRSGRAVWAWQMLGHQSGLPLGFLHQFYYQTLAHHSQEAADGLATD